LESQLKLIRNLYLQPGATSCATCVKTLLFSKMGNLLHSNLCNVTILSFSLHLIIVLSFTNHGSSPGNTPVPRLKGLVSETRQAGKVFYSASEREPLLCKVALGLYLFLLTTSSSLYTVKLIHAYSSFL